MANNQRKSGTWNRVCFINLVEQRQIKILAGQGMRKISLDQRADGLMRCFVTAH